MRIFLLALALAACNDETQASDAAVPDLAPGADRPVIADDGGCTGPRCCGHVECAVGELCMALSAGAGTGPSAQSTDGSVVLGPGCQPIPSSCQPASCACLVAEVYCPSQLTCTNEGGGFFLLSCALP